MTSFPPDSEPPARAGRTLAATGAAIGLCLALVGGVMVRNRIDLRSSDLSSVGLTGLVASRKDAPNGVDLDAYYDEVERILMDEYVDPIKNPTKLEVGAVRGMVASLGDPYSQFMNKAAFAAYRSMQSGKYVGVGAEFCLKLTPYDAVSTDSAPTDADPTADLAGSRVPRLTVLSVAPGGPAAAAGVRAGDWVESVDGHWVVDPEFIAKYRKLAAAEKPGSPSPELIQMRHALRARVDSAILPPRALAIVSLGASGPVTVEWGRAGSPLRTTALTRSVAIDPGNSIDASGAIRLRFDADSAAFLRSAVKGKSAVRIDLRDQPSGYQSALVPCLSALAPAGAYGSFESLRKGERPKPLVVESGASHPPKITLLVDGSVHGVGEMFALALSGRGLARLSGSEMSDDRASVVVESLSDGSGYTLQTGVYAAAGAKS